MSVCENKPYKNVDNITITRKKSIQPIKKNPNYHETSKNLTLPNANAWKLLLKIFIPFLTLLYWPDKTSQKVNE